MNTNLIQINIFLIFVPFFSNYINIRSIPGEMPFEKKGPIKDTSIFFSDMLED